jgi:outer membrane immunogenic protein
MKKILLGTVATGALVAAGSAHAADLGSRPVYKAAPVVPPVPAFSWTGCYVGAHGGWGWGRHEIKQATTFCSAGTFATAGTIDTSGAIFGGQLGCDYQFAGNFVIGLRGTFAGATLNGDAIADPASVFLNGGSTNTANIRVRTQWLASITGRLGFSGWVPRTLLYIQGGGAWVREKWDLLDIDTAFGTHDGPFSISQTRTGWTIGGGVEYAIAPNWSLFAEFNHYDFGSKNLFSASGTDSIRSFSMDTKTRIEAVTVGVNYRFNWGKGKAPVVAKY